jgi:hypothetical protein
MASSPPLVGFRPPSPQCASGCAVSAAGAKATWRIFQQMSADTKDLDYSVTLAPQQKAA